MAGFSFPSACAPYLFCGLDKSIFPKVMKTVDMIKKGCENFIFIFLSSQHHLQLSVVFGL